MNISPKHAALFWAKIKAGHATDCWPWQASRLPRGYGRLTINGTGAYAHRIAYTLKVGKIPPGFSVCHKCDNPACCNPAHLFLGTHLANMKDCNMKWRSAFGVTNGSAKLTSKAVIDLRKEWSNGAPPGWQRRMANKYGVSQTAISKIVLNKRWRHLLSRGLAVCA